MTTEQLQLIVAKQGGAISALMSLLIDAGAIQPDELLTRLRALGKYDETDAERAATHLVVDLLTRHLTLRHGH